MSGIEKGPYQNSVLKEEFASVTGLVTRLMERKQSKMLPHFSTLVARRDLADLWTERLEVMTPCSVSHGKGAFSVGVHQWKQAKKGNKTHTYFRVIFLSTHY